MQANLLLPAGLVFLDGCIPLHGKVVDSKVTKLSDAFLSFTLPITPIPSVVEAAFHGLSSLVVSVDEEVPSLLNRLEAEGLSYEVVDLRK